MDLPEDLTLWKEARLAARSVAVLLGEKDLTLSLAESCTGGLLGYLLTGIPGISAHFLEGFITYSDEAKRSRLGVSAELLASDGAVSDRVARAMAQGVSLKTLADVGVGVTGIAGPGGGTPEKPVGNVYIAVSLRGHGESRRLQLGELHREEIRLRSAIAAFELTEQVLRWSQD